MGTGRGGRGKEDKNESNRTGVGGGEVLACLAPPRSSADLRRHQHCLSLLPTSARLGTETGKFDGNFSPKWQGGASTRLSLGTMRQRSLLAWHRRPSPSTAISMSLSSSESLTFILCLLLSSCWEVGAKAAAPLWAVVRSSWTICSGDTRRMFAVSNDGNDYAPREAQRGWEGYPTGLQEWQPESPGLAAARLCRHHDIAPSKHKRHGFLLFPCKGQKGESRNWLGPLKTKTLAQGLRS